jgi:drug/metabolite transporter (DMT)-like permease
VASRDLPGRRGHGLPVAVSFLVCAAVVLPVSGLSVFATRRPRDHLARGLSQSISQTFTVIAFSLMPLAGAIAINFSAPLWAALLSVVWLKERADAARWTALLSGFLGVLVVANPGTDSLTVGALFALACGDVRQRNRCRARHDGN